MHTHTHTHTLSLMHTYISQHMLIHVNTNICTCAHTHIHTCLILPTLCGAWHRDTIYIKLHNSLGVRIWFWHYLVYITNLVCRELRLCPHPPPPKKKRGCSRYVTKLHLLVRLCFWGSVRCGLPLHCHDFPVC